MATEPNIAVEKLRGESNYSDWKFAMRMKLIVENLWNVVENGPSKSEEDIDQQALAKICLSIGTSCFVHVVNAKTAKDAWDSLGKAYGSKCSNPALDLAKQLFETKRSSSFSSMEEYMSELCIVSQQLKKMGHKIDEGWLIFALLKGVYEDDPNLVTSIVLSNDHSFEAVKSALLEGISAVGKNEVPKTAEESSTMGKKVAPKTADKSEKRNEGAKKKQGAKPKVICHSCGEYGHIKPVCPKNPNNPNAAKPQDSQVHIHVKQVYATPPTTTACTYCKSSDHDYKNCPILHASCTYCKSPDHDYKNCPKLKTSCTYCKASDHDYKNCLKLKADKQQKNETNSATAQVRNNLGAKAAQADQQSPKCYHCGLEGHIQLMCPFKSEYAKKKMEFNDSNPSKPAAPSAPQYNPNVYEHQEREDTRPPKPKINNNQNYNQNNGNNNQNRKKGDNPDCVVQ